MRFMAKFYTPEFDKAATHVHINLDRVTYFTTTELDNGTCDVNFYFGSKSPRSGPPTIKVNMNGDDVDSLFSAMDDKEMFV